jgi:hypothetical protein
MRELNKIILENGKGVTPQFSHQMSVTNSLNVLSSFLVDMGVKLKEKNTVVQIKKYEDLGNCYRDLRNNLAQLFIHEANVFELEQKNLKLAKEILELRKEVEKLKKINEF